MTTLSVTRLHLCQRCPRLLAFAEQGESHAWRVGLSGSGETPGRFFHDRILGPGCRALARGGKSPFARAVADLLAEAPEARSDRLDEAMRRHLFLPAMREAGEGFREEQAVGLLRGIASWAALLADHLNRMFPAPTPGVAPTALVPLFSDEELSATRILVSGRSLRVTGRCDAIFLDPGLPGALIAEFKGLGSGHADEDLTQLALYAWLFREKTGMAPSGVVVCLEAEEPPVRHPPERLQDLEPNLHGLLELANRILSARPGETLLPAPVSLSLCEHCPFQSRCDETWGERVSRSAPESGAVASADPEAETRLAELLAALSRLGVPVSGAGWIAGPRFIRCRVVPDFGRKTTVARLRNQADNLQVALELEAPPLIQSQAGYVAVDLPRRQRTPLTLMRVLEESAGLRPRSPVAFPLGLAIDGTVRFADLAEPSTPGMLVGGTTGSGKTVFLQAVVVGLCLGASPGQVAITLVDPKRVGFSALAGLPHLDGSILHSAREALEALTELTEEMERRYERLARSGVENLTAYHLLGGETLPHRVVVVDEYADLMVEKNHREALERVIQRIGQKGRAAGLHLLLATQRPDARVVTPLIKANLPLKIALKVANETNSRIILDESGAERLLGFGDMLVAGLGPVERLQGPLVTGSEIRMAGEARLFPTDC